MSDDEGLIYLFWIARNTRPHYTVLPGRKETSTDQVSWVY